MLSKAINVWNRPSGVIDRRAFWNKIANCQHKLYGVRITNRIDLYWPFTDVRLTRRFWTNTCGSRDDHHVGRPAQLAEEEQYGRSGVAG